MCIVYFVITSRGYSHGYNSNDLLIPSIFSIPKDSKSSLCNSDNYRGISLFNIVSFFVEIQYPYAS